MLMPRKTKHRKQHKGRIHGHATQCNAVNFGEYGLKAMEPERLTARQIESARRALTRYMKRMGRVWIRVFPDIPVTAKPAEVRMGSGKGSIDRWVCRVKPGRILFEISSVPEDTAKEALRLAAGKLPISTLFVKRTSRGE